MRVFGLDRKTYKLNTALYRRKIANCSKQHSRAREILTELFGMYIILEEVCLPGTRLEVDFFIPDIKMMIEVNGQQHYEYVQHFHGSKQGFYESKKRDNLKREWCDINAIKLIELNSLETDDEWRQKLDGR